METIKISKMIEEQIDKRQMVYIIIAFLLFVPITVYVTGGTKNVYIHLMYIPIILSARNNKVYAVIITSLVAGLLVGPFMPVDVKMGQMQPIESWVIRMGMFLFVGLTTYLLDYKNRRNQKLNQLILHSVTEGICLINSTNEIVFMNGVFCSLHSIKKEDYIGTNICTFLNNNYDDKSKVLGFTRLEEALMKKTSAKNLMIPRSVNSFGEIITQYEVRVLDAYDELSSVIIVKNIEDRLQYERNLLKLSYTDALTGVKNRRAFEEYITSLKSTSGPIGVIFADIDGIKFINDSFGHVHGDRLIINLALILDTLIKEKGFLARYDGDAFVCVIPKATSDSLDSLVLEIAKRMSKITVNTIQMSVSCGYSLTDNIDTIQNVIKDAEDNMYLDKNSSKNAIRSNPIDIIINTLHEKDNYSEQHSKMVSSISNNIATALALPMNQVKEITTAALLHDIGKIIVPIDILQKQEALSFDEYEMMKEHTEIGYRLLSTVNNLHNIPDLVLHHHEKWDGTGYPLQKKGTDIPLGARIISVADAYNAMTTKRPYRDEMSKEEALNRIIENKGTQFDPMIVDVFVKNFDLIVET